MEQFIPEAAPCGIVGGVPVILVHGILGNRHLYWNLFKHRLEKDKFRVHEALLPYSMLGDIRIAARTLSDKVDATLAGDQADKVDMVCHSAGGLVARYYLKFLGGQSKVRRLVLLGTPHRGTYFSFTLPLLNIARQARPGAKILDELGPDWDGVGVELINFWSPVDGIVIPAENSRLRGAHNVRVDWMHHWGFLVSSTMYEQVKTALRKGVVGLKADAS